MCDYDYKMSTPCLQNAILEHFIPFMGNFNKDRCEKCNLTSRHFTFSSKMHPNLKYCKSKYQNLLSQT